MRSIEEIQKALARDLRAEREQARLTQEQLALIAAVSTGPIYQFESGRASIRLETYLRLLDALGLELSFQPRKPNLRAPVEDFQPVDELQVFRRGEQVGTLLMRTERRVDQG